MSGLRWHSEASRRNWQGLREEAPRSTASFAEVHCPQRQQKLFWKSLKQQMCWSLKQPEPIFRWTTACSENRELQTPEGRLSSSASFQLNRELKSCFFLIFERNVNLFYFEFFVIWIFSLLFNNVLFTIFCTVKKSTFRWEQKLSTNTIILVPRSYFRSKIRKSI